MSDVILSAPVMDDWEQCRRRWQWDRDWEMIRTTPMGSVYRAIKHVLGMPTCEDPSESARKFVMSEAGDRGLYTSRPDPYQIVVHHAHLAGILATTLRKPSDGMKARPFPTELFEGVLWSPEANLIDNGMRLERFVLVDHWDDDRQVSELHSWRTIGDVCVTGLPMTMRILIVGPHRLGRRYGHFTRAHQHPYNHRIMFRRKGDPKNSQVGDGWEGSWRQVWREEVAAKGVSALQWLQGMARDKVLTEVAFERHVRVPESIQRQRVLDDIRQAAREMQRQSGRTTLFPMSRSMCDWPIPCPFQTACFSSGHPDPEDIGLFRKRTRS